MTFDSDNAILSPLHNAPPDAFQAPAAVDHTLFKIWANCDNEAVLDAMADHFVDGLFRLGLVEHTQAASFRFEGPYRDATLRIEPRGFSGGPFAFARVARVRCGNFVQVLNAVFFPRCDSPLPIFGCEILVFSKGVHLYVLDFFPTIDHPQSAYVLDHLAAQHGAFEDLELRDRPQWGPHIFSDKAVIIKPGARRALPVTHFAPLTLATFQYFLRQASPGRRLSLSRAQDRQAVQHKRCRYIHDHGHEEPAGPFLTRIAGEDWVERFTFDFLYPTWLYDQDSRPPWSGDEQATSSALALIEPSISSL